MPRRHSYLSTFSPTRANAEVLDPSTAAAVRALQEQIDGINAKIAGLAGPGIRPTGPSSVTATARHGINVVRFSADGSPISVRAYRVWRADAGTVAAPIVPSASVASQIGTVAPTWRTLDPNESFVFIDGDITDADAVPPEAMFMYWVSTLDIRERESPRIPASGGPIACVV
jgi:hypothetical protein